MRISARAHGRVSKIVEANLGMEDQRTIRLTASPDMVLIFIKHISETLTPTLRETGADASFDLAHDGDNNINAVSVTVPHPTWEVPLLRGIAGAMIERQEVVYVSGWPDLCEKLLRIPWFRAHAAGGAATPPTAWTYSPTGALSEVGRLDEVNRLLCSWVFVGNVYRAVSLEFGGEGGRQPDEMHLIHPTVTEEAPYRMYSLVASAWCEGLRLPPHLATGAALIMGDQWRPSMEAWLLNLRPDVRFEVGLIEGRYGCRITASHSVIALLEDALLCLGNLVVAGTVEYMQALRVNPNMGEATFINQSSPEPTMHRITAAMYDELGVKPRPALDLADKPALTLNSYGQMYMTISAATPIEDRLLEGLRKAVMGHKG